jgi:hypothetical protein
MAAAGAQAETPSPGADVGRPVPAQMRASAGAGRRESVRASGCEQCVRGALRARARVRGGGAWLGDGPVGRIQVAAPARVGERSAVRMRALAEPVERNVPLEDLQYLVMVRRPLITPLNYDVPVPLYYDVPVPLITIYPHPFIMITRTP